MIPARGGLRLQPVQARKHHDQSCRGYGGAEPKTRLFSRVRKAADKTPDLTLMKHRRLLRRSRRKGRPALLAGMRLTTGSENSCFLGNRQARGMTEPKPSGMETQGLALPGARRLENRPCPARADMTTPAALGTCKELPFKVRRKKRGAHASRPWSNERDRRCDRLAAAGGPEAGTDSKGRTESGQTNPVSPLRPPETGLTVSIPESCRQALRSEPRSMRQSAAPYSWTRRNRKR